MREELERIRAEALAALERCDGPQELETVRVQVLGRKGSLTGVLRGMRDLDPAERRAVGELANRIKTEIEERIAGIRTRLEAQALERELATGALDVTIPGRRPPLGHIHPLTQTFRETLEVFATMGFSIEEGPDVEDDYHNFEALNIPEDHPARDMQDTFFVEGGGILRTHTSPVQIRVMEERPPPLRIVAPGAVYRHDDDATHSPMFHQLEGFLVDRGITFGDLKGVLREFLERIFGSGIEVRFRASFFPFTEPSAEVDCRIPGQEGWTEILGAGMIDPNVFRAVGYDPETWSGFAFGIGIERVTMIRNGIPDIRSFFEGDLRFLRQF